MSNNTGQPGDFWGVDKPADPSKPLTPADAEQPAVWTKAPEPKPRRRRWVIWTVGSGVALGVLVAAAPTVAGWLAPSVGPGFVPVKGKVTIESASFGWFSGQTLGKTIIVDDKGKEIASFQATTDVGLFGLIFGSRDLGKVRVTGSANIVRATDGSTNFQRAFKSDSAPGKAPTAGENKPPSLPPGLAIKFEGDFDVAYTDEANPKQSAKLSGLKVTAEIAAGEPLKATVRGKAEPASGPSGDIAATINLESWSEASGKLLLDTDKPKGDVSVDIGNFPTSLLAAFAPEGIDLSALGETVAVSMKGKGGTQQAEGGLTFTSANAKAKADVATRDGKIMLTAPAEITVNGRALAGLAPQAAALTRPAPDAPTTLAALPDVTINVASLSAPMPRGGALDLRGTSATITASTSAVKGTVTSPGQKPAAFEVAPMSASVSSDDLAKGASIKAATRATIDGKPAGVVDIDFSTGSVLDASGAPIKSIPAGFAGKAMVTGIATAILQPFLKNLPIDLNRDIGPTLDLRLTAKQGSGAQNGPFPPADLEIGIVSEQMKAAGQFTLEPGMLRTRGEGLTASSTSAARMLAAFLPASVPVTLAPAGRALFSVKDLSVPLRANNTPELSKASGSVVVSATNWAVAPKDGSSPVDVRAIETTATLAPGKPLTISSRGTMVERGKEFTLAADASVPGLLTDDPAKPVNTGALLSTIANLEIKGLPTSLARFTPTPVPAVPDPSGKLDAAPAPLTSADLESIARDAIGDTMNLRLTTSQAAGKGLTLSGSVAAERFGANLQGTVLPESVKLTEVSARSTLTPESQRGILTRLGKNPADLPELVAPATMTFAVEPITIPMVEGSLSPNLSAVRGDLVATMTASEQVLVRIAPKPGQPALGTVGIKGLKGSATLPFQIAMGTPGGRGLLKASLTGTAIRSQAGGGASGLTDVGAIAASAEGEISDHKLAGTMNVSAAIRNLATVFLDDLAGKPGYATGALGDTASLESRVALTPPPDGNLANATIRAEMGIASPRLSTASPIKVDVLADRITVTEPAVINWSVDPAFANLFMTPAPVAGKPAEPASVRLTQPTTVSVNLRKATFSRSTEPGDGIGPLKPGIFDLAAGITSPGINLTAKDGTATKLTNLALSTERTDGGLTFNVAVAEAQAGAAAPVANVKLPGVLTDYVDAKGNFNAETARVTAVGDLPAVPTIVLDTLAAKDGLLVEALGPVTTIKVDANKFGKQGGALSAMATSSRASFDLAGTVENGLFVNTPTQPMKIGVTEVTQALSNRVVKGLPLFGKVEKSAKDRPAMITGSNLKVPLSNDLTKLDGDFQIDPGEVTFEIAGDFADIVAGPILAATKGNASGRAGQKLAPMTVNIKSGVARLQRWSVPVGEFTVQMDGTMNLATGEIDFVTYFPAGALALEKLKLPGGALGSIAGDALRNTLIPVRTKGTTAARTTAVDTDAAAKELLKGVDPGKLIEKGLQDLFKPKK
jgi:hypothetical protein